jgi:transposase
LNGGAAGAEAMVTHLNLMIALHQRDRLGASAERGRKLLDQLEMQLEEIKIAITEDEVAAASVQPGATAVRAFTRARPVRAPLPSHLPRERVVLPSPTTCPCCGGRLSKLGETITETLECVPRTHKVIQTVREQLACRSCEMIAQPPALYHPIARGRAGANLQATVLHAEFAEHQPSNRQSEGLAREGIDLSVSTLADWVGACMATLSPLVALIRAHVLAGERIHGDDTTVSALARPKTVTGCLWAYVRDDRPFGGPASPAVVFAYSRDRGGTHPCRHLPGYARILQADA